MAVLIIKSTPRAIHYSVEIISLICLSLSVAADAFVTSVCDGLAYTPKPAKRLAVAAAFGTAQGIMPVLGALLGEKLAFLTSASNYIAFAALLLVGVLMIIDGFDKKKPQNKTFGARAIIIQAVATSIDAFFCGVSLVVLPFPLWVDGLVIGGTTAVICLFGIFFATAISKKLKTERLNIFKFIGGAVLIALAMKNLVFCFV